MKFNGKNFDAVVAAHQRWLSPGAEFPVDEGLSSRADFSFCRLEGIDFHGVYLDKANFENAVIHNCDFNSASLSMVEFNNAELYRCNFGLAKLSGAEFVDTKIFDCDFFGANLYSARFIGANIGYTNFKNAQINDRTCFNDVVARHLKDMPYIPMVCPEEGEFVAWKAVCASTYASTSDLFKDVHHTPILVKLLIPADAKRSSGFGRKCRASKAKVLDICNLDGREIKWKFGYRIHSCWHWEFEYEVGKIIEPEEAFNEDRWSECASGIHFFMNRREAIEYSESL